MLGSVKSSQAIFALFISPPDKPRFIESPITVRGKRKKINFHPTKADCSYKVLRILTMFI